MISNIQRLLYLCHIKNDLNRKRRRFYYYMNHYDRRVWNSDTHEYVSIEVPQKHISVWHAKRGYRKAQREMKAMTKEMRAMRIEMGARIIWGESGNIIAVEYQEHRVPASLFKSYYEAEVFEMELFKEKKR